MYIRFIQSLVKRFADTYRINRINRVLSAYSVTPPIWLFLTAKLQLPDNQENVIWQAVIAKLQVVDSQYVEKWRMKSAKLKEWSTPPDRLFNCVVKGMT